VIRGQCLSIPPIVGYGLASLFFGSEEDMAKFLKKLTFDVRLLPLMGVLA
jgi:hypothetical protein